MTIPQYPIEKSIPIPVVNTRPNRVGSTRRFPWKLMEVGDSFLVPEAVHVGEVSVGRKNQQSKMRFAARTVEGGVRVWRIK